MFADTRTEWRITDIERSVSSVERRLYEIDSLRGDVARLERANGELVACVDGFRATVEACLSRIEQLERTIEEIRPVIQ